MNGFFENLHDICGRVVLPLVIAFGLGLVVALEATDGEAAVWKAAYAAAQDRAEHIRIVCGAQPDPEAVAEKLALHEVMP